MIALAVVAIVVAYFLARGLERRGGSADDGDAGADPLDGVDYFCRHCRKPIADSLSAARALVACPRCGKNTPIRWR